MRFLTICARNLQHRRTRTVLTMTGVAAGIAAVVALASMAWGFEKTWVRVYTARGTDLIVTKAGSLSPVPAAFPRDQVRAIESLPHVSGTSGMLSDLISIEDAPIVLLFGWESNTYVWEHLRLVSGRWPANDEERSVVLGTVASDLLNKRVGDRIRIERTPFDVVGVFESASLAENGAVVMTLPRMQSVTDQAGKINFLNIRLAADVTPADAEAVRRAIAARQPEFRAFTAGQVAEHNAAIQAVKAMSWATCAIALVVGSIGVMNTMLMSVFERMPEIGLLRAVGWKRRRIVSMVLCESLALSVGGGAAGIAAGIAVVKILERTPLLRGKIAGDFSPLVFGLAIAVSVGLGMIGGIYPAYRGASMRPADALRRE